MFKIVLAALIVSSCSPVASAPPPVDAPPAVAPVAQSEAITRADALLAEMKRNEVAFAKLQSEPPPPIAPLPPLMNQPSATETPNAPRPPLPSAAPPAAPSEAAPIVGGKDETWWKDRARALTQSFEEAERNATAARLALNSTTLRITQDQARAEYLARLAAVGNIQAEIERFQEDGRRANVPSGWLRWP